MSRTRAGGFAERSWTIGTVAQDGDRCRWRRSQSMKHTAQLSRLRSRLRRHAGEYDLLPLIVADLSEENLERAPLVLTSRPHVAAVDGECNRFAATAADLEPAPATASCSSRVPTQRVRCRVVSTACGLPSGRNSAAASAPGGKVTANPSLRWSARTAACIDRHDLGNRVERPSAGHRTPTRGKARRGGPPPCRTTTPIAGSADL